jgi:4'-phosphopantetheinyl transferase
MTGGLTCIPEPDDSADATVVDAHWMLLDVDAESYARFASMLAADERQRAAAFRNTHDGRRYVVRRGRLRELLARRLCCHPRDVALSYTRFGKPRIDLPRLHFNLSHAGGVALYVLSDELEVGCDIEWATPALATGGVVNDFFSRIGKPSFASVPGGMPAEGFFVAWTRYEAFVKGLGCGLSHDPDRNQFADWSVRSLLPAAGLHVAIAARSPNWRLSGTLSILAERPLENFLQNAPARRQGPGTRNSYRATPPPRAALG